MARPIEPVNSRRSICGWSIVSDEIITPGNRSAIIDARCQSGAGAIVPMRSTFASWDNRSNASCINRSSRSIGRMYSNASRPASLSST